MARKVRFQGQVIEFPDGTPDSVVSRALMGQAAPPPTSRSEMAMAPEADDSGSPFAGAVGAATEALGGLRGVGIGAGGVGAALLARRALGRRSKPSGKLPAGLVELSEADIKAHPEFRNFKPGETMRRATYEKVKLAGGRPVAPEGYVGVSPHIKRKPVRPPKGKVIDIGTAESRVANRPPPAGKPRGASGPVLERRGAALRTPYEGPPDLEKQLAQSLEAEQAMSRMGVPLGARPRLRASLKAGGGAALQILLGLLDAQSIPQQMDEAHQLYLETLDPMRRRLLEGGPRGT
jgi:hypothetical protein